MSLQFNIVLKIDDIIDILRFNARVAATGMAPSETATDMMCKEFFKCKKPTPRDETQPKNNFLSKCSLFCINKLTTSIYLCITFCILHLLLSYDLVHSSVPNQINLWLQYNRSSAFVFVLSDSRSKKRDPYFIWYDGHLHSYPSSGKSLSLQKVFW